MAHADEEGGGTERAHDGETEVDRRAEWRGPAGGGHDAADGKSVERFVQSNSDEGAKSCEPAGGGRGGVDRGTERDAVDQGMDGKSKSDADPTEFVSGRAGVVVVGVRAAFTVGMLVWFFDGGVVGVEVEGADQQEHEDQSRCKRIDGDVEVAGFRDGMREELEEANAEHEAADATHHDLHAGVCQANDTQKTSTSERGERDDDRIEDEEK